MSLKLHPSYITDIQSLGLDGESLSDLWIKSNVPMYSDSECLLIIDNPCAMEVINIADIRFKDRPTITIMDKNGNELYVDEAMAIDETFGISTKATDDIYLPKTGGIVTGGISMLGSPVGFTFPNGQWNNIGDDTRFGDINVANTFGVQSTSNNSIGYVRFGNTASGATIGTDGTSFTVSKDTVISGALSTTGAITEAGTLLSNKYVNQAVQYTNPTWLAGIDASTIKTGTIDLARFPAFPSANTIVCTTIPEMSAGDQLLVAKGTVVIESTTGNTYRYSGTGSLVLNASYILVADSSPDWSIVTNRPTNVSYWANDAGYLTNGTGDSRYLKLTGGTLTGGVVFGALAGFNAGAQFYGGRLNLYKNGGVAIDRLTHGFGFGDAYTGIVSFYGAEANAINALGTAGAGASDGPFLYGYRGVSLGYSSVGTTNGDLVAALRTYNLDVFVAGNISEGGALLSAKYAPLVHTHTTAQITGLDTTLATFLPNSSGVGSGEFKFSNGAFTDPAPSDARDAKFGNKGIATAALRIASINGLLRATNGVVAVTTLSASDIPALDWSKITTGKPTTFAPSAHTHAQSEITGLETRLAGIDNNWTNYVPKNATSFMGNGVYLSFEGAGSGGIVTKYKNASYPTDLMTSSIYGGMLGFGYDGAMYENVYYVGTGTGGYVQAGNWKFASLQVGGVDVSTTAHTHTFDTLTSKPTTLAGYGITSADTLFDAKYSNQAHNHDSVYLKIAAGSVHGAGTFTALYPTLAVGDGQYGISALGGTLNLYSATGTISIRSRSGSADSIYKGDIWHSGNFNPATKSDTSHVHTFASLTSKPTTLAGYGITDAQANLGYTPVQQGGGTSQTTNKVYIGWSAGAALRVQVDSTDFGSNWPISITGYASGGASGAPWSGISGKPTTLSGYGITDAVGSSDSRLTDARTPINNANYVFGDNGSGTRLGTATSSSQATLKKSGFYSNSTWTDAPVANTWTHLIHNQYVNDTGSSNSWSFDIAANFGTAATPGSAENYYMRCIANSITTGWRKLWHDGNFDANRVTSLETRMTGVDNNWTNYIAKSGGTMTGALNFANGTWNTVGDDVHIGDINEGATLGLRGANTSGSWLRFCAQGGGNGTGVRIGFDGTQFKIEGNTYTTGTIRGVNRPDTDYGTTVFAPSTGSRSAISNGTNSVKINRWDYSGFVGYIGDNTSFFGMTQDHANNTGGQLAILAGGSGSSHIGFFAGAPVLLSSGSGSGCYQVPQVGHWNNTELNVYNKITVAGEVYANKLRASAQGATTSALILNTPMSNWAGICISSSSSTQTTMIFSQVDSTGALVRKSDISANSLVLDGTITTGNGSVFNGDITVASCAYIGYGRINATWSGSGSERFVVNGNGRFTDYLAVNGRLYANDCSINGQTFGSPSIIAWNTVYNNMDYFVQGSGNGLYGHRSTNISSFDALLKSGFYDMNAAGPFGTTWQYLIRATHTDPSNGQDKWSFDISAAFANGNGSEGYKMRVNTSAGWGTWRTIWTDLNLNQNCSTNAAPTFAGLTVTGQINASDTINGILFGGNGRIWWNSGLSINDPTTISLRIAGGERLGISGTQLYTSYRFTSPEFHTSWGINGTYNFYGLASGNTNNWATTGGFATNTTDTWIGGTNSFNVWIGGSTNVITANGSTVSIGKPLYCSELHSTGSYAGTGLFAGTGDGATYSTFNQKLTSWYGTGIYDACNGVVTGYIDHRLGKIQMKGDIISDSWMYANTLSLTQNLNVAGGIVSGATQTANYTITDSSPTMLRNQTIGLVYTLGSASYTVKYIVNGSSSATINAGGGLFYVNGSSTNMSVTLAVAKIITCVCVNGNWYISQ